MRYKDYDRSMLIDENECPRNIRVIDKARTLSQRRMKRQGLSPFNPSSSSRYSSLIHRSGSTVGLVPIRLKKSPSQLSRGYTESRSEEKSSTRHRKAVRSRYSDSDLKESRKFSDRIDVGYHSHDPTLTRKRGKKSRTRTRRRSEWNETHSDEDATLFCNSDSILPQRHSYRSDSSESRVHRISSRGRSITRQRRTLNPSTRLRTGDSFDSIERRSYCPKQEDLEEHWVMVAASVCIFGVLLAL